MEKFISPHNFEHQATCPLFWGAILSQHYISEGGVEVKIEETEANKQGIAATEGPNTQELTEKQCGRSYDTKEENYRQEEPDIFWSDGICLGKDGTKKYRERNTSVRKHRAKKTRGRGKRRRERNKSYTSQS